MTKIGSDDVRQLILSQFGNSNPLLLALLSKDKDSTQTNSEYLKQVMLSSIGTCTEYLTLKIYTFVEIVNCFRC